MKEVNSLESKFKLEMSTGRNLSARPGKFHFLKISARLGPFIEEKISENLLDIDNTRNHQL